MDQKEKSKYLRDIAPQIDDWDWTCVECGASSDKVAHTMSDAETEAREASGERILQVHCCAVCGLVTWTDERPIDDEEFERLMKGVRPEDQFTMDMLGITLHNRIPESQENS